MLEKEINAQTRNLPVYVICPNTRHRIINQVMYEEFIYGLLTNELHWENKASERLANFGILLSPQTLLMNRKKIRSGERDPSCVANFSGKISEGEVYTSRYGKDGMYKQLKMMVDLFVKDKSYVGLPANQILSTIKNMVTTMLLRVIRMRAWLPSCLICKGFLEHQESLQKLYTKIFLSILKQQIESFLFMILI